MKNLKSLFAAAAAGLGGLAALAMPQAALAQSFEGEYLALQGGVSVLDISGDGASGPFDDTVTRPIVVAAAGFRFALDQDSPVILGIEGDLGFTIDDFDSRFGVSGIAGYRVGERTMPYLRAGYASRSGVATGTPDRSVDGWLAGGGVEYALSERLSARLDYRYSDLGGSTDVLMQDRKFSSHELAAGLVIGF